MAVIYARYSSHNQRDESIEDQVRLCEEEAEKAGDTVIAVYFDRAITGTTDRRPAFQAMVRDAQNAGWGRVWTYKTDRFARDRYDAAIYKRKLRKCGADVKYAAEQIPDGPMGIIVESLLEGLAEYYSANLAENVLRGLHGNALKCHPNGQLRYGWDIAGACIGADGRYRPGDHYEVNERESRAVRSMYLLRAKGWAWTPIADRLNSLGHRNKYGRPITGEMVAGIVRNDAYKGVYRYGDVVVHGGMPPIVTAAEWEAAQDGNRRRSVRHRRHVYVRPGMRFGDLEVKEPAGVAKHHTKWLCECHACGGAKVEWSTRLTSGRAVDCGCRSGDGRERDELGRFA